MTYRVEISVQAERDGNVILEWLVAQGAGGAGRQWFIALEEAIASLDQLPERCPLAAENREFPFEVRQLLFGKKRHVYRVLFAVEDQLVRVLHIRHGRRRPLSIDDN
jgi:plasmid stabilization system protein ParE